MKENEYETNTVPSTDVESKSSPVYAKVDKSICIANG